MNSILLTAAFVTAGIVLLTTASAAAPFAQATEVEVKEVYHPEERPAFATRAVVWHDPAGNLYMGFPEKRRAPNPLWEPVPLDFWESMGLPIKYHISFCDGSKDILTERVVLKSTDDGATWTETGRSPTRLINAFFAWACLSDGQIIHVLNDSYIAFDPDYEPELRAEVSANGGKTWQVQAVIMKGYCAGGYRLRRMSDGTLVLLAPYGAAFGPGRVLKKRGGGRPHVRSERTCGVFVSQDEGRTWSGPQTAFPGVTAPEPDFVELPSGDLLFLNSKVQRGGQVRQYFHKTEHGFVPGAVFNVVSGTVPECLVLTRSGLLVGAVRGGQYSCSNDEGANWYKIEGLPNCRYQPYITELSDGRLLCVWYIGGDYFFAQDDQWIGTTTFRVEANLPQPTRLDLSRELNEAGTKYVNKYVATLTCGGEPLVGKTVHFAYNFRYDTYDAVDDDPKVTDEKGQARVDLSFLDEETNIHQSYGVRAWFKPEDGDSSLGPCRSNSYGAYAMTMSAEELNP